ncbi:hypothetical protein V8J88_12450 [Massilia sp. W12]|uniref:hypothetical protein n=1 Tax=Massilia sp. W12 TaxID=3126507 RepID=UPI0030CF8C32
MEMLTFRRFLRSFLSHTIHDLALMIDRMRAQREPLPSAGIVDSQSVKAPGASEQGMTQTRRSMVENGILT